MRIPFLILVLYFTIIFIPTCLVAQENNTLNLKKESELSQIEDSVTVKNLIEMGIQYFNTDIDLAKIYLNDAEKISLKINYKKGLADSYFYSGLICKSQGKLDSSFFYFNSSLFISRRINNKTDITRCLIELALYNQSTGDYPEAIRNYFRSLDILLGSSDISNLGIIYHNLGSLYLELNKNEEALNYCIKAFDIEQQYNDSSSICKSLYNIAKIYYNLDSLDQSQFFFERSLEFNTKIKNKQNIAETYLGIALLLDKKQQFETSTDYYRYAIEIFKTLKNDQKLAWAYYYYGNHMYLTKKINQALEMIHEANTISKQLTDLNLKRNIYTKLQEIYTQLNQYEKALQYSELLNEVEEKLKIPETLQYLAINEAELNFKLKEEKTRLEHESLLKKQKNFKLIFLGSSIFTIILIILSLIWLIQKNRHNKLLKKANDTRDKMFRLIAHDFRSPLISISNTVHLIPYKIKSKDYNEVINLCDNVTLSVNRVLNLIDNLINWTLSQHDNIPYKPEIYNLYELCNEIIEIYRTIAGYKSIELKNSIPSSITIYADKNILNTVFRNLINNAIKFTQDNGAIVISAEKLDKNIEIMIKDNGTGIPKDKLSKIFDIDKEKSEGTKGEKGNGLGLFFCKEFVKKNKGEIWVESEQGNGSRFYFTVPLNKS